MRRASVPIGMWRTDPIKYAWAGAGCVSSNENSFPPTEERKLLERGECRWCVSAATQKIKRANTTHVSFQYIFRVQVFSSKHTRKKLQLLSKFES